MWIKGGVERKEIVKRVDYPLTPSLPVPGKPAREHKGAKRFRLAN